MSHRAFLLTIAVSIISLPLLAQTNQISPTAPVTDQSFGAQPNIQSAAGSITGSVNALDGTPVDQSRIEVHDTTTGAIIGHTYSRQNGSFALYNIPKGYYEVVATKGVVEARERVDLAMGDTNVNLRMSNPVVNGTGDGSTVSVSQFRVPSKARKEYDKAQKAFLDAKYDEAIAKVNKALDMYAQFPEALTLRGILEVNAKNVDQGQADLQQAIKYDPNYGLAYFAMGASLNQQGKFDDAIRSLDRGISAKPDGWQGYFEMARASLGKGLFKSALQNCEKALKLSNDVYAPIHVVKAHALMGMKDYQGAVAELEHYLTREPQGAVAASARRTLDQAKSFVASGTNARATTAAATE